LDNILAGKHRPGTRLEQGNDHSATSESWLHCITIATRLGGGWNNHGDRPGEEAGAAAIELWNRFVVETKCTLTQFAGTKIVERRFVTRHH